VMPVTRFEIVEWIGDLLDGRDVRPPMLVATARRRGARRAVLKVLAGVPDQPYGHLSDLWAALPQIPEFDPWYDGPDEGA
jgi:hypothetical protein